MKKIFSMKIHQKILILNLFLAFVPLLIAGTLAYRIGVSTLHLVIGKNLQQSAAHVMDSVDRDLYERIRVLRSWSNLRMMQDVTQKDADGRIASLLSDVYENNTGIYHGLICVNTEGIIVAASDPSEKGRNVSDKSWFRDGVEQGITFVGPVQPLDNSTRDLIGIAQPIRTYPDRQKIIGVLVSLLNWESLSVTTQFQDDGSSEKNKAGFLTIVDADGTALFTSSAGEASGKKTDTAGLASDSPSVQKALGGESGYLMESGTEKILFLSGFAHSSGYKNFKGLGWSAVLSVPKSVAFEPVYRMGKVVGIVGLLCLCLIPAIAILFSKGITRPLTHMIEILKDLAEGEGDLTRRIEVFSNDEIKDLAHWMNTFTGNIQGIVRQIKETMKNVSASSGKISENTDTVSSGAQEQSTAIEEISSSMDAMDSMIRQIAENSGNLALHTEEASSSILEMSASIDEVAENTKQSAGAVDETASSINQMVASIDEISANLESLSSNADQTAASVEEIDRSIREVEKNAKNSLTLSKETVGKAEGGMKAVTQTQEGMAKIKETFEASAQVIQRLGKKSAEIGKILRVIDDVADQTNLLALNAAIIAAQAGEHGKGFAVVADEIKALAERSAASSGEIGEVIRNVQKEAAEAVHAMEVSASSITQGMDLSLQAGEALKEIVTSANLSGSMIDEIAQTTIEQSKGSQMVRNAVESITDSLRQIAQATQEQKNGSKQIMANTERLREIIVYENRAMQDQSQGSGHINKSIEEINDKTQAISKSAEGQTQKTQEVLSNSKKIELIAKTNTRQVQEMIQAINDMAAKIEHLHHDVDKFKV